MNKKQPSNVFTVPNWMKNLRVREPEGTYTPDQVADLLEINLLFNGDADSLRECVASLVPKVPLKHQKVLKAFMAHTSEDLLIVVRAFITKSADAVMVLKLKEASPDDRREEEQPAGTSGSSIPDSRPDWGEDDDLSLRRKPSTRGLRALRASKRQQAEA